MAMLSLLQAPTKLSSCLSALSIHLFALTLFSYDRSISPYSLNCSVLSVSFKPFALSSQQRSALT